MMNREVHVKPLLTTPDFLLQSIAAESRFESLDDRHLRTSVCACVLGMRNRRSLRTAVVRSLRVSAPGGRYNGL